MNPYRIDAKLHAVQTVEYDGENGYLFRHDFLRLDASNFQLLLQHENDTVRRTERLAKGKQRSRFDKSAADKNLYIALVQSGGWRPADLVPYKDGDLIPHEFRGLYQFNEETQQYEPGWNELTREQMLEFTPERMSAAVDNYLQCKGEYLGGGSGIDFMFEKGGLMRIRLNIGDPDDPSYKVLLDTRRPESVRRNKFRRDFVYSVEHTKGENAPVEVVMDLQQGVSIFDEHFASVVNDPQHSQVMFNGTAHGKVEAAIAAGEIPEQPPSIVDNTNGEPNLTPYHDALRNDFLALLNPMFKVEIAAAMMQAFTHTDRELPTR